MPRHLTRLFGLLVLAVPLVVGACESPCGFTAPEIPSTPSAGGAGGAGGTAGSGGVDTGGAAGSTSEGGSGGDVGGSGGAGGTGGAAPATVILNEIYAGNPDWVEILNVTDAPIDISGWMLRDSDLTHVWAIPQGTIIEAGQYLVFDQVEDFPYGLAMSADEVHLMDTSMEDVDATGWNAGEPTAPLSWGRYPNATGIFQILSPTRGATNELPSANVVLNEVSAVGGEWIELHNAGTLSADISGWTLTDDTAANTFVVPAGTTLPAGTYISFDVAFDLGEGGDSAHVYDATMTEVDSTSWLAGDADAGTSWGRFPDAVGPFQTCIPTKSAANQIPGPDVVVNEVSADPVDWIELYNAGTLAADLSGWTLTDSDPLQTFVVPAGTILAPGAYVVFDAGAGTGEFSFDLDPAGDAVHVLDTAMVEADSTSWTTGDADAPTAWGRFPNGTGAFGTTTPTKGATNQPAAGSVVVNEVAADPVDWIELYNAGTASIDISGWTLTDNNPTVNFFVVPAGTVVAAGGYVVFDQGMGAGQFAFGLGKSGDEVHLFDTAMVEVDSTGWTTGQADGPSTWGRYPNGSGAFQTLSATKGATNVPATAIIVVNELAAGPTDWIELYNAGTVAADISGWKLTDSVPTQTFFIPAGTILAPGAFVVYDQGVNPDQFSFGLSKTLDEVHLYDTTDVQMDVTSWMTGQAEDGTSWGRLPNGSGAFQTFLAPTKGTPNL